jgi:hypothetical protein
MWHIIRGDQTNISNSSMVRGRYGEARESLIGSKDGVGKWPETIRVPSASKHVDSIAKSI